jgi:c-di-GMP-binding flagellar brake protein YcgR
MAAQHDRRRAQRVNLTTSAKLFEYKTYRYRPAQTRDLSTGGTLLEVAGPHHLSPGDRVDVAVALERGQPIIDKAHMMPAVVVRLAGRFEGRTLVAMRFLREAALPVAA